MEGGCQTKKRTICQSLAAHHNIFICFIHSFSFLSFLFILFISFTVGTLSGYVIVVILSPEVRSDMIYEVLTR